MEETFDILSKQPLRSAHSETQNDSSPEHKNYITRHPIHYPHVISSFFIQFMPPFKRNPFWEDTTPNDKWCAFSTETKRTFSFLGYP